MQLHELQIYGNGHMNVTMYSDDWIPLIEFDYECYWDNFWSQNYNY